MLQLASSLLPAQRSVEAWPWAADNDAFSEWNQDRYVRMLDTLNGMSGCLLVTAPDVVGDWEDTFDRFEHWQPELMWRSLPIGYVLQDGQPERWVPWDRIAAVFIGGSDRFKMGDEARQLAAEAKRRGKWLHMGRVNGHRRVRYAKAIGCDSIDGTSLSWFRDRWLQDFIAHAAAPPQLLLEAT